jgi:hypothetical protein
MSGTISSAAGRAYRVRHAYAAWASPRANCYAASQIPASSTPNKREPTTALDDAASLGPISEDLATTSFTGEDHRRVFGRLHDIAGHHPGCSRLLRLMRARRLLSTTPVCACARQSARWAHHHPCP